MSNRPARLVTCTVSFVTIAARLPASRTTPLPMCRSAACVPVTYQPPQRTSNGLRWSVVYAGPYCVVPSTPGKTLPTNQPGTFLVASDVWHDTHVSLRWNRGVPAVD